MIKIEFTPKELQEFLESIWEGYKVDSTDVYYKISQARADYLKEKNKHD
jgi:DNA-binding winged helix-turn-helix (wHTH) protein